jgi:molecular chaperone GrpE
MCPKSDDDYYELELDDHNEDDVRSVIDNAVEAVEAVETRHKGEDGSAASAAATAVGVMPVAAPEPAESAELVALRERYLRTMADFENYRKRTDREKEQLRRFAAGDVIRDVLDALDNLERALASSGTIEELKQGLQMVLRQQEEVMRRHGALKIDSLGKPFDPALHEAVMREDSASVAQPTVVAEYQRGYLHHDRLLRPAMVKVAMPSGGKPGDAAN